MNAQVHMTYDARKISQADAFHGIVVAFPLGKEQDRDQNGFSTVINKIKVHSYLQSTRYQCDQDSFSPFSAFSFFSSTYKVGNLKPQEKSRINFM